MMLTAYAFEKLIKPSGQFCFWLQGDLQLPEIDFLLSPNFGHSVAHAGLPVLTHSGSRGSPNVTLYTRGLSHFVTSMTAPTASGWGDGRVELAPTGKAPPYHGAHPERTFGDIDGLRSLLPEIWC